MTTDATPVDTSASSEAHLVDESYRVCREITHRHGANFSVGFRFLPKAKREAVHAAYAFCRHADDIADDPGTEIEARLDSWQHELDACYEGHPAHPITIALHDALRRFPIPRQAFIDLIDGCRQDLVKTRYETFDELVHYCDLVATSISQISLSIFGYREPSALSHGRDLATALQLTNVTRDIGDDLRRDRIYIPAVEMRQFGITEDDLRLSRATPEVRKLIEFQIDRAAGYFNSAEPLLEELEFDARFPVLLMGSVYCTVLKRLEKNPDLALGERISLPTATKIAVVLSRLVRPHFL